MKYLTIRFIDGQKENIFPLIKELNEEINEKRLKERLSKMEKNGYKMVGIFKKDEFSV